MSGTFLRAEIMAAEFDRRQAEIERLRAVNALLLAACKQVTVWVAAIDMPDDKADSIFTRASLKLLRQVTKEAEMGE